MSQYYGISGFACRYFVTNEQEFSSIIIAHGRLKRCPFFYFLNSDLDKKLPYSNSNSAIAVSSNVDQSGNAHLKVSNGSLQTLLKFWTDQRVTVEKYDGSKWSSSGDLLGNADIQMGSASVALTANGITEFNVTFPKAFSKNPNVFVGVVTSRPDLRPASVVSRSTSGFSGAVSNGTTAGTVVVFWTAMAL